MTTYMLNQDEGNMLDLVATSFAGHATAGWQALTRGAVYLRVKRAVGTRDTVSRATLEKAMVLGGLSAKTAGNYASKCLAITDHWGKASLPEFDAALTFAENCKVLAPLVATAWDNEINNVTKLGLPSDPAVEAAKAEREAKAKAKKADQAAAEKAE